VATIHPTALVDPKAQIDPSVTIGPYSVVGPDVCIGRGTRVGAHCVIEGQTRIGQDNQIFQFNSIGAIPQDKKYAGERSELHIGDGNTIREFCTINLGVQGAGGVTRIGSHNWIMAYCHIAHDCHVDDHTTLANNTTLGGHVHLGDWVTVGGLTGIHQFVKIGAHAMVGFASAVSQDVPPFMLVDGNPLGGARHQQCRPAQEGFFIRAIEGRQTDAPAAVPGGQDSGGRAPRHRRVVRRPAAGSRGCRADEQFPGWCGAWHCPLSPGGRFESCSARLRHGGGGAVR
jgi:UDP-N-acetylglucosamine acyltransferase